MSWQEEIYKQHLEKRGESTRQRVAAQANVLRQSTKGPNKTETRFENDYLKAWSIAGEVERYAFEDITLKIANGCRYTPDWCVKFTDPSKPVTFYEIKARKMIWDDAIVKLKVAADRFPYFYFYLCAWDAKSGWAIQRIFPA
jgi:hypothetical protein